MVRRALFPLIVILMLVPVSAQRRYASIVPTVDEDALKFDVNAVPVSGSTVEVNSAYARRDQTKLIDLNFAPHMVFSPDSSRGFVNYSGTDKVVVFDPKSGDIVDMLTVGPNPSQLTLSPDGKKVALVCLFLEDNLPKKTDQSFQGARVGSFSLIDVETLAVQTLDLTDVFFSFANNVVFSPDSSTAFVASSGTDSMLRFDLGTVTEISPRLALTAGARPTSLTMAPDGTFMTVVRVGSPGLSRTDVPDAVDIIDAASFSVAKTIAPKTGQNTDNPVIHDFTATTNVAISPDSKYGVIADQQFSAVSTIPELGGDRVWLIDFTTREFVHMFEAGGIASGAYVNPNGGFIVVSAFDISLIDAEAKTSRSIIPTRSNFRPRSRPCFSPDGTQILIGAPLDDLLVVLDIATGAVTRLVDVGGEVDREGRILTSAPMDVAYTPDNSALVVLNYNANSLDLVKDTKQLFIPRVYSDDTFFTGVALTNVGATDAEVVITGLTTSGLVISDDAATENVVEYVNPVTVDIPSGTQKALTSDEWLEAADGKKVDGWLDVDSDDLELKSFFLTGDLAGKRMDGSVANTYRSVRLVFPEVRVADGMISEVSVANPNRNGFDLTYELYSSTGELLATVDKLIASRATSTGFLKDNDPEDSADLGIFPAADWEDFEGGYVIVTSDNPLTGWMRYYDTERMAAIQAFPIAEGFETPAVQYVAQVALFQGNDTLLTLVNPAPITDPVPAGEEPPVIPPAQITLTLKDDGGNTIGSVPVVLESGHSMRESVATLFGLVDQGAVVSGWIEVESDRSGVVGDAEMQLFSGKAMTTVPLLSEARTLLTFSHVAEGMGLSTGLSLLNPGTADASVQIEVFAADGTLRGETQVVIPAGGRSVDLVKNYLPELGQQLGGFIKVSSDHPLFGLELFFQNSLELVSAVAAQ